MQQNPEGTASPVVADDAAAGTTKQPQNKKNNPRGADVPDKKKKKVGSPWR